MNQSLDDFLTEMSDVPHGINVGVVLVEHDEHRWRCDAVRQSLTVKVLSKAKRPHKTINGPRTSRCLRGFQHWKQILLQFFAL